MSGGAWDYMEYRLREDGQRLGRELPMILDAVADVEHLIDWAVSCDTSRERQEPLVYDRMRKLFDDLTGIVP